MSETPAACPMCGCVQGRTLAYAQPPALLAVCDVLVVKTLETVGKRIVRADRSRFARLQGRPWHIAHTLWKPDPGMVDKGLAGSWDVIPAMLDNHGCCDITSAQIIELMDRYVRQLLSSSDPHQLSNLRSHFEKYLGIAVPDFPEYA